MPETREIKAIRCRVLNTGAGFDLNSHEANYSMQVQLGDGTVFWLTFNQHDCDGILHDWGHYRLQVKQVTEGN